MAFDLGKAKDFISHHIDSSAIPTIAKYLLQNTYLLRIRYIEIPNQSPAYDPQWASNGFMDKVTIILCFAHAIEGYHPYCVRIINVVTSHSDWIKEQNVAHLSIEVERTTVFQVLYYYISHFEILHVTKCRLCVFPIVHQ